MKKSPLRARLRQARIAFVSLVAASLVIGGSSAGAYAATENPVDAHPPVTASISGLITDAATAAPIPGARVVVLAADSTEVAESVTGASGGYTVGELAGGDYFVSVIGPEGFDALFYPDAESIAGAHTVTLADGEARTGVDVTLTAYTPAEPPQDAPPATEPPAPGVPDSEPSPGPDGDATLPGGDLPATDPWDDMLVISGHVTDEDNQPMAGVSVTASGSLWGVPGTAQTDEDGYYEVRVFSGAYRIEFSVDGYPTVYNGGTPVRSLSPEIAVADEDVPGIDVAMQPWATITGTLTGREAEVFGRADLRTVHPETGESVRTSRTIDGDKYSLLVPPGSWAVSITGQGFAETFHPGALAIADATVITAASGQTLSGIDIAVQDGYTISGKVSPTPVSNGRVSVTSYNPSRWHTAPIAADGTYTVSGLGVGNYVIRGEGDVALHQRATGYYGSPLESGATAVPVTGDITDIDFPLHRGGAFSGSVTTEAEGTDEHTLITAYRWDGAAWDVALSTSTWGAYSLGEYHDIPEGEYTVEFSAPGPRAGEPILEWQYDYCPQYYSGKNSLASADRFAVTAGETTEGIDAVLTLASEGCDYPDVIAGSPAIQGTPKVGETLRVDEGTWGPTAVEFAYQWYADDAEIDGATAATLELTADMMNAAISVKVTGSRPGHNAAEATSARTAPVLGRTMTPGTPVISGALVAGQTLTVTPGTWAPADAGLTFQWYAGATPIAGATGATFVPGEAEVGKNVQVRVTGSKPGYATAEGTSAPYGPIAAASLPDLTPGTPRLNGAPVVGTPITVDPGTWGPSPVSFTYEWRIDTVTVPGATSSTYTPAASDAGKKLTVVVRGSKPGYNSDTRNVSGSAPVAEGTLVTAGPTITGTARVGSILTAVPGTWGPQGVALSYQWFADSGAITGATGATYTPTAAYLGARITVRVSGSLPGYTSASQTSAPSAEVGKGQITAGTPVIIGEAKVGVALRVDAGRWTPSDVALSYQWFAGDAPITGATGPTYTPTAADFGASLTVRVSGSLPGYTSASRTSAATAGVTASAVVSDATLEPGQLITISGDGFQPFEEVRIELHSTPVLLTTVRADANGRFSVQVAVPSGTPVGAHTVWAFGTVSGRQAPTPVSVSAPLPASGGASAQPSPAPVSSGTARASLPRTGGELPVGFAVAGVLLMLAGAGLYGRGRTRRTT